MKTIIAIVLLSSWISASAETLCLSGDAARSAFVAEGREPYFSLLQPREMAAKTGHAIAALSLQQQRDRTRAEYAQAVLTCTPDEEQALRSYVARIDSKVGTRYPGLTALPWHFIKVNDTIEGGLPHTRENVIVLSQSMLRAIEASAQNEQWDLGIVNVLLHEQIHVMQRVKTDLFEKLYSDEWGFRKAASITGAGAWLAQHQVVNPDGVDVQWVWPVPSSARIIWPRVILDGQDPLPSMPDDFRMVGIELAATADGYAVITEPNGTPRYHSLRDEPGYMQRFGAISSIYHPNEIAADFLATLAILDCFLDQKRVPQEQLAALDKVYDPLRRWAHNAFGAQSKPYGLAQSPEINTK